MPRRTRSAAAAAVLAATMATTAAVLAPAAASAAGRAPAYSGREVFKIVARMPGPRHAAVSTWGAFSAQGHFVRRRATIVLPRGKLVVRRHVVHTAYYGPDLGTCRFTIVQTGSFLVSRATGRYRGLRESGSFTTTLHGRLRRTGPGRCGSAIVARRTVTYETGTAR